MQFAVPQFTEVEDRLIARLTLKQFFVLLGTGAIIMFFWSILGPSFIFFVLALPIALAGIGAALGSYNGRPMFTYIVPMASYLTSTRVRVFKREEVDISVSKAEIASAKAKDEAKSIPDVVLEPTESRLKKLAYLLDGKAREEKEIVSDVFDKITAPPKVSPLQTFKKISTVNTLNRPPVAQPIDLSKYKAPVPKLRPKPLARKFDPNNILQN